MTSMNIQRGTKGRREAPALFECWQQSKQTKSKEAQKEGLQPPPSLNFCAWGTKPRRLPRQGEITPHKTLGPEYKNIRFRIQILHSEPSVFIHLHLCLEPCIARIRGRNEMKTRVLALQRTSAFELAQNGRYHPVPGRASPLDRQAAGAAADSGGEPPAPQSNSP